MSVNPGDPGEVYSERHRARVREAAHQARRERLTQRARLAVFAVGVVNAGAVYALEPVAAATLLLPAAAFLALVMAHDGVRRRRARADRAVTFYERGLARLELRFAGQGRDGLAFLDPDHPYARALDLFGRGSLYELLSQAQTVAGEEILADWLAGDRGHAARLPATVRARQFAVQELQDRVDLREDLFVAGSEVRSRVDSRALAAWGGAPGSAPVLLRVSAAVLGAALVSSLGAMFLADSGAGAVLISGSVALVFGAVLRRRVRAIADGVEGPARALIVFGRLLERIERERFECARLRELRAQLDTRGASPSREIRRLRRRVELLDARRNQFFAPLAPLILFATQVSLAIEAWRLRSGPGLERWIESLGEIEALCDLAGYAYEHPDDVFPELVETGPLFAGRELAHPLLDPNTAVRNDVDLGLEAGLWVVSGSNMSGKSTLLRTVGTNAVLAFAGAPVRARNLRLSPLALGSSIHVQDSLQDGKSGFFAEITRLRQIMALVERAEGAGAPVLFLLDEILAGTNSHDRRIGAAALIERLIERGAIGLVTTHDLSLCAIADDLGARARNVHFEDRLEDGEIRFDYELHEGVVQHSNALALMRQVGLEV